MKFCPSCGLRLTLTRKNDDITLSCSRCGFEKRADSKSMVVKKFDKRSSREDIVVIGKEEKKLRTMPTAKVECPRCGNHLAYTWQVQTRSGDEGATQFFRCTKCDYTSRLYT